MCLYPKHVKPRIADRDLEVVKLLFVKSCATPREMRMHSPYKYHDYELGKEEVCPALQWVEYLSRATWGDGINYGLHAYVRCVNISWISGREWLFKAIIPKGAEFFVGHMGDVVSNRLIVTRPYTRAEIMEKRGTGFEFAA